MLVNKEKKKDKAKTKQKKTSEIYEENIQSMRSWVRKIEQTTNSVSSRLSAVEKRLSVRSINSKNNSTNTLMNRPFEKVFSELKKGNSSNNENIVEVSKILDSEFDSIQDELVAQQSEIEKIKKTLQTTNKSIVELKEELKKTRVVESKHFSDYNTRLELMEKRAAPIMKLGKLEVPIEISGIIAGFIAIFAALFILMDQSSILISPAFLGGVGFVFIGSAVYKAARSRR